jgi:outer membrane protein assembly factor BamD
VGSARESFADFGQLLARFPGSEYAPDARQRMVYLRNLLARSEILSGRFYLERDAYVAAVNRGRNVVENFPSTPSVADGLALMIEGYLKLNLPEPANDALAVLAANYPDYPNLDENGHYVVSQTLRNRDRSFLNIATFGLLDDPEAVAPIELALDEPSAPTPPRP